MVPNRLKYGRIVAKFIGTDGSLGYRKGKFYTLDLVKDEYFTQIQITCPYDVGETCVYERVEKFLQNWKIEDWSTEMPDNKYYKEYFTKRGDEFTLEDLTDQLERQIAYEEIKHLA